MSTSVILSPWAAVAALKASCRLTATLMFIRFTCISFIRLTSQRGAGRPTRGEHNLL